VPASPSFSPNAWLRYDLVQALLERIPEASSFLEVGCGMGALAARLVDRYEYVGYEPDAQSCEVARRRVAGRGVVINGILPAAPVRCFHVLGAFEVLEHLKDDGAALAQWRGWICPGGHVMLSVPANPKRFAKADVAVGHYRRYTRDGLRRLLEQAGFDTITVWSYGFPLGYVLELARNVLASGAEADAAAIGTRTAASGRFHQPGDRAAALLQLGTAPFRVMQRPFRATSLGTGLLAMARVPA
jgi:SAM-dependent methyltransferase